MAGPRCLWSVHPAGPQEAGGRSLPDLVPGGGEEDAEAPLAFSSDACRPGAPRTPGPPAYAAGIVGCWGLVHSACFLFTEPLPH